MEWHAIGSHRLVELRFKPLWLYVDAVREFCGFFARASFEDDQLGQRVGLVVHGAFVENAVRYGDDQELELRIERNNGAVLVSVINTASEDRADKLRKNLHYLNDGLPPEESYALALRRAAGRPSNESGLGLPSHSLRGPSRIGASRRHQVE